MTHFCVKTVHSPQVVIFVSTRNKYAYNQNGDHKITNPGVQFQTCPVKRHILFMDCLILALTLLGIFMYNIVSFHKCYFLHIQGSFVYHIRVLRLFAHVFVLSLTLPSYVISLIPRSSRTL